MNKKLTRSSHGKKTVETKNKETIITKVKMVISARRGAWGFEHAGNVLFLDMSLLHSCVHYNFLVNYTYMIYIPFCIYDVFCNLKRKNNPPILTSYQK